MMLKIVLLATLIGTLWAIPIDNGLAGEPEVQCGPTSVQISFQTENSFEGMVYAKNHHNVDECAVRGDGAAGGNIEMNFESCNVRRRRSIEPKGIYVTATVVIQFHPNVLTKIDRAFHVQCFYMEADKTVDQELEVSMVTTEFRTFLVPMPVCRYDILEENENGNPIRFVTIGQKIYHKWTCDTETTDTFCMEVYSCTVDDGTGNPDSTIVLLDEQGCGTDLNLLSSLEYPTDLMGGQQTHVFKYADRPQLYFNCQIRIGVKEPGSECAVNKQLADWRQSSSCQDPPATFGRKKRSARRQAVKSNQSVHYVKNMGELDVAPSAPIFVADVELTQEDIPQQMRRRLNQVNNINHQNFVNPRLSTEPLEESEYQYCVSNSYVGIISVLVAVFAVSTISLGAILFLRK